MATFTWVGGGKNLATDAKDWDIKLNPTSDDFLVMYGGTMNVVGDALHGAAMQIDVLQLPVSMKTNIPHTYPVVNYKNAMNEHLFIGHGVQLPTPVTLNFSGTNTLSTLFMGVKLNVNIAANSTWHGRFIQAQLDSYSNTPTTTSITINGAGKFSNEVEHEYEATCGTATINVDVIGTGMFSISQSRMEFGRAVGAGQTIIEGDTPSLDPVNPTILVLDKPAKFDGLLRLNAGEVDLKGLFASSYGYKDDLLSFYNGRGKVVETLRVEVSDYVSRTLQVVQASSGVVFGDYNHIAGVAGTVLSVHV